jgi:hypothetical protein
MRAAILFIIILIVILIFQGTSGVRVRTSRNALIQWQCPLALLLPQGYFSWRLFFLPLYWTNCDSTAEVLVL